MRANNPLTQKLFLISWYIILLFWEFIFPLSCAEIMPSKHGIIVDNTLNGMKRLEKDSCKNKWNWNWLDKFGKTPVGGVTRGV